MALPPQRHLVCHGWCLVHAQAAALAVREVDGPLFSRMLLESRGGVRPLSPVHRLSESLLSISGKAAMQHIEHRNGNHCHQNKIKGDNGMQERKLRGCQASQLQPDQYQ